MNISVTPAELLKIVNALAQSSALLKVVSDVSEPYDGSIAREAKDDLALADRLRALL